MTKEDEEIRAYVEVVDGQVILHDPAALAVIHGVDRFNCRNTAIAQKDRVIHFARRAIARKIPKQDALMTLINVDSRWGAELADILVPGQDWQAYRDRGEIPFARGLAQREGMQRLVDDLHPEEGKILRAITGMAILVVDFNTLAAFTFHDLYE